jgi:hypothetical protein
MAAAAQRLLAASTKIIGVGRNYVAHAKELGNPVPKVRAARSSPLTPDRKTRPWTVTAAIPSLPPSPTHLTQNSRRRGRVAHFAGARAVPEADLVVPPCHRRAPRRHRGARTARVPAPRGRARRRHIPARPRRARGVRHGLRRR